MSTLKVNEITDTTGSLPPVFPAGSAQLNPLANREDKIINGDFGIWQRGTTTSGVAFAADRWLNNGLGGGTTQSRQAFTVGETLGANSPTYFLRQTVSGQTNPATNFSVTVHKIEGVRSYAGQTITILGWARRSSGAGNMCLEGIQSFGTTGGLTTGISPSIFGISPTTVMLTGSWAPFAIVVTFPSITGKTLGTDGNDWSGFQFFTSAGSDYNVRTNNLGLQNIGVDFWGIHIRQGTWTAAATADYRPRDPGTELALCQRYYYRLNANLSIGGRAPNFSSASTGVGMGTIFPVQLRATPLVTIGWEITDVVQVSPPSNLDFNNQQVSFYHTVLPGGFIDWISLTADAEL